MNLVLALFLIGIGVAILVSRFLGQAAAGRQFPRHRVNPSRSRQRLPVAIGAVIVLGGAAMLLLATTATS